MKLEPLLEVNNLTVSYAGIPVVQDVTVSLEKGEIAGLVGESGCGKSTLLNAILRFTDGTAQITAGEIRFAGTNLVALSEEKLRQLRGKDIGMVFQDCGQSCNPVKTIGYHFWETMNSHGEKVPKQECHRRAAELLRTLRLQDPERMLKSYPFELSGGMNQRVGLALAMINNPKLLLADEPTSALDVTVQMQVIKEMHDLRETFGTAMLVVTHSIGVVAQLCDTIGVMYGGRIVEWGPCRDVLESPIHPYTRALIEAVPDEAGRELKGIPGMPPDFTRMEPGCPYAPRCPYVQPVCHQEIPAKQCCTEDHWALCHCPQQEAGETVCHC